MFFLVSHKYKFLLGWSAKCGCSSVKNWYLDVHGIDKSQLGMPVYKAIGYAKTQYTKVEWGKPDLYRNYRKYAVVRNPYSRVVSGFVNKYIIENRLPNRGWSTFNQFLNMLSEDIEFKAVDTHHFTHQFSEAYHGFERAGFGFDMVIRMENLDDGLKTIGDYHKLCDKKVSEFNKTRYGRRGGSYVNVAEMPIEKFDRDKIPPFQYFYDASTIERVRVIYDIDFRRLKESGIHYDTPEI